MEPDPKALEYYRTGQSNYTWQELAEMSLWASGCTADSIQTNMARINQAVETMLNLGDFPSVRKERAEYILTYLHRNILQSYSMYQTGIDAIFINGRYNCVSSAVLYAIFCKAAGIDTTAVITRDHSFITVHIDGENIDVETTNRYGFDPGNRREFQDQFGRVTGFSYVPPQNYRERQNINLIELVSLILNNRISEHERQGRFAEAVPLAVDRAALLLGNSPVPSETIPRNALFKDPYGDLLDRIFNYGAVLLRNSREEEGIQWVITASLKYPVNEAERLQEYYHAAINNRISRFLRARQITEGRDFLESQKYLLTDVNYAQLDTVLLDARAADYHNRFAAEWNRRNYEEAERILNEGLTEFPDNRQLLNNKARVENRR